MVIYFRGGSTPLGKYTDTQPTPSRHSRLGAERGQDAYLDCLALVDFNYVETETVNSFSWCYKDRLQREKVTHIHQDLQIKITNNSKLLQ